MILTCAICGCAYLATQPWDSDWCSSCFRLNFPDSQDQERRPPTEGDPMSPAARLSLASSVCHLVTDRQRRAIDQLTRRWAEEEGL